MKVGHAVTNYYMKMEFLIKMIVLSTQLHVKNEKVSHFFYIRNNIPVDRSC